MARRLSDAAITCDEERDISCVLLTAAGRMFASEETSAPSARLPRPVGVHSAREMAITNRRASADEAATMGVVTRAVEDAALADDARKRRAIVALRCNTCSGCSPQILAFKLFAGTGNPDGTGSTLDFRGSIRRTWTQRYSGFLGEAEARIFLSDNAAQHQSTSHSRIS